MDPIVYQGLCCLARIHKKSFSENKSQMKEKIECGNGTKIRIIEPFCKIAADGYPFLVRVDDPRDVQIISEANSLKQSQASLFNVKAKVN